MTALPIKSFGGISPKVPARYLPDTQAQVAINSVVFSGSLQPLKNVGTAVATLTKTGTPKTIYRFGQSAFSDSQYWFHWTTDVNVCRGQITGDTSEWTFYTGDGAPKMTYSVSALSGTDYPTVSYPLGIPAPDQGAGTSLETPFTSNATLESRVYVYTYVARFAGYDVESAPSPVTEPVDAYPLQTVTVIPDSTPPSGYNITHQRLYRSVSGTFLFVAELPIASTEFVDDNSAEALGEELPSLTWSMPPSDLKGLTNLPNGVMAGFTGRDIYFCDPYHPHAWPVGYSQSVDFPVVGLGRMDTTLAVLTTGTPYFIQGSHPDSMVVVKSDVEQACASKRSIVSANGAVFYASPDGLIQLMPGGSRNLTEQMFTRAQWQEYFLPSSIHAYQQDMKYIAFYDNGTTSGGFIFDLTTGQFIMHDIYATAGYNDLQLDKLFVAFADRSVKAWGYGSNKTMTWKSKKFSMPREMGFSCAQLESEGYPMTMKFYVDNTLKFTQTVASRAPFRLPTMIGRDHEVQIEGAYEVFSVVVAQSMEELKNV